MFHLEQIYATKNLKYQIIIFTCCCEFSRHMHFHKHLVHLTSMSIVGFWTRHFLLREILYLMFLYLKNFCSWIWDRFWRNAVFKWSFCDSCRLWSWRNFREKTAYINIFNIMRHLVIVWNKPMPKKYAKYTKIWYLFQLSTCKEVIEM